MPPVPLRPATRAGARLARRRLSTVPQTVQPAGEVSSSSSSSHVLSSAARAPRRPAMWRVRVTSFLVGAGLTSFAAGYVLRNDIWESAVATSNTVASLRADYVESDAAAAKRMAALEERLARLENSAKQ